MQRNIKISTNIMILAIHAITGAVLASESQNIWAAAVIGLVSHYFLDSIPHIEYKIQDIQHGNFRSAIKEFITVFIDLATALLVIIFFVYNFSYHQIILTLTGAFFAILPDGLVFWDYCIKNKGKNIFTKFLDEHNQIHAKIHSTVTNKFTIYASQLIILAILILSVFKK